MIGQRPRAAFSYRPSAFKARYVPMLSVMLASMLPILPIVTTAPLMPPLGFMTFVVWRLIHREIWHPCAGVVLGAYDDMWSGQPIGSGIVLWSLAQFIISLLDRQTVYRDFTQDWIIGVANIALMVTLGLLIANNSGGHMSVYYVIPQIILAALILPLVMRACAAIDRWRFQ